MKNLNQFETETAGGKELLSNLNTEQRSCLVVQSQAGSG